jgi:hypothetical protein
VQIYKNNPISKHETQKKPRLACRGQKKDDRSRLNLFLQSAVIVFPRVFKPLEPPLLQYIDPYCDGDGTTNDAEQEDNKSKWERLFHLASKFNKYYGV